MGFEEIKPPIKARKSGTENQLPQMEILYLICGCCWGGLGKFSCISLTARIGEYQHSVPEFLGDVRVTRFTDN